MFDFLFLRHNPYSVRASARNQADGQNYSGALQVRGDELLFEGLYARVSLPLHGLCIRRGSRWWAGAIEYSHRAMPNWLFYSRDERLLGDPAIEGDRSLMVASAQCRLHFKQTRKLIKTAGVIFLLLFVFCRPVRVFTTNPAVRLIPARIEENFGERVFDQIKKHEKIVEDPRLQRELDKITSRVIAGLNKDERGRHLHFHLALNDQVNAFAIPGGHIVVYSGLIEQARSAEEVAGVIAHEIGHVTRQHSLNALCQKWGTRLFVWALMGDDDVIPDAAYNLVALKYSRDHESEADESGLRYLKAAHVNPAGLSDFFDRIAQIHPHDDEVTELLSTHPLPKERANALRVATGEGSGTAYLRIDMDFEGFKETLRGFGQIQQKN